MLGEKVLPYKKTWTMFDRIERIVPNRFIVTKKCISSSDFFLQGHFKDNSIFPGVLMLEGIKQSANFLLANSNVKVKRIQEDYLRLKKVVLPGDVLYYDVHFISNNFIQGLGRNQNSECVVQLKFILRGEDS